MSNRALTKTLTYGVINRIGSPLCAGVNRHVLSGVTG